MIKHLTPKSEEELKSAFESMDRQEKLKEGVEKNMLWLVKNAIETGADVHIRSDYVLRYACCFGLIDIIKVLLDAGADRWAMHPVENRDSFYWASFKKTGKDIKKTIRVLKTYKNDKTSDSKK